MSEGAQRALGHRSDWPEVKGGVVCHDGQFDDRRLLTHLIATAVAHKATVLNCLLVA